MSDEYGVDLDEVYQVIESSDVLVVRFHILQKRLLVDFRTRPGIGPYVAMVEPASSAEERFRAIKETRPEFPLPERVMSFQWPRMIGVLLSSGIWQRIVDRAGALGGADTVQDCAAVLSQLVAEEQREVQNAIRGGEHYQTLWERQDT